MLFRSSGAPPEVCEAGPAGDATWEADLAEFERRVPARESSLENDWRISAALADLLVQAPGLGARERNP